MRSPWYYAEPMANNNQYLPRLAGYAKHFLGGDQMSLDLLTVKGGGKFYYNVDT
jgi:hypothetical protein